MKLGLLTLAFAPCSVTGGRTAAGAGHRVVVEDQQVHPDAARDIVACTRVARQFIKAPAIRAVILEHAENFCDESNRLAKSRFACDHFQEAVESALSMQQEETKYDASSFCEATETYMLDLRGATRVPNMGSGPLQDFKVSSQCTSVVSSAIKPQVHMSTSKVPDFWYAMCMNQNCAHFLPSRTKWCNEKLTPTHSVVVCEALRKFALDEAAVHEEGNLEPKQMCDLYGEFVREMGIDVDSYEHVIHSDSPRRLPSPGSEAWSFAAFLGRRAARGTLAAGRQGRPGPHSGSSSTPGIYSIISVAVLVATASVVATE